MRAERRRWAAGLASESEEPKVEPDAAIVLELFGAQPVEQRYGVRGDTRVVVAPAEGPVTEVYIDAACAAATAAGHRRVCILGWEWSSSDAAILRSRLADKHEVELSLRTIPVEAMRGKPGRGKLSFLERPEVELELVPRDDARRLSLRLTDLRCSSPLAEGDEASWSDLVDAWMVDWDGEGEFEPSWRSYRTRDARDLALETPVHDFSSRDVTMVRVRVLTVFGDEIERQLRVEC
jgi:hypothetical protein